MTPKTLARMNEKMPVLFDDFFRPWNEWFNDDAWLKTMSVPAVNITEHSDKYLVSLAAPGLKKEDFKIDIEGNLLNISSEKKEESEEQNKKYTRKEYNYSSFSRTFTLPEGIKMEGIEANYENGVLLISIPRNGSERKPEAQKIPVK